MNNNYESHAISRRSFLKVCVGAASLWQPAAKSPTAAPMARCRQRYQLPPTPPALPLKEFISWESTNRELESWNMLYSQRAEGCQRGHQPVGRPAEL